MRDAGCGMRSDNTTADRSNADISVFLQGAVKNIRKAFPQTRRIILFGSHAYGHPSKDSDLDLFIELPTRDRPPLRHQAIDCLLDPRPCGIDLIVKTPQEVRQALRDFNPCFEDILHKGRVLYAKKR